MTYEEYREKADKLIDEFFNQRRELYTMQSITVQHLLDVTRPAYFEYIQSREKY